MNTTVASVDAMQMGTAKPETGKKTGMLALIVLLVLVAIIVVNFGLMYGLSRLHSKPEQTGNTNSEAPTRPTPTRPSVGVDGKWIPSGPEGAAGVPQYLAGGAYKPHPTQAHADALRGGPFVASATSDGLGSASKFGRAMDMSSVDGSGGVMGGRGSAVPGASNSGNAQPTSEGEFGRIGSAELKSLLEQGKTVVLGFFLAGCGPCKMFKPLFMAAARQNPDLDRQGKALIHWVDAESELGLCKAYNVGGFPTVMKISKDADPVPFRDRRTTDAILKFAQM
jgi:thiol-disulfide isomerase/thioredoxin